MILIPSESGTKEILTKRLGVMPDFQPHIDAQNAWWAWNATMERALAGEFLTEPTRELIATNKLLNPTLRPAS